MEKTTAYDISSLAQRSRAFRWIVSRFPAGRLSGGGGASADAAGVEPSGGLEARKPDGLWAEQAEWQFDLSGASVPPRAAAPYRDNAREPVPGKRQKVPEATGASSAVMRRHHRAPRPMTRMKPVRRFSEAARFMDVNGVLEGMRDYEDRFSLPVRAFAPVLQLWKGTSESTHYPVTH